jgi:hypothetical protein
MISITARVGALAAVSVTAILALQPAQAQTSWVTTGFMPPGATFIQPLGLNDRGEIVGGVGFVGTSTQGFVYRSGSYELVPLQPGAWAGSVSDISGSGAMVGTSTFGTPGVSSTYTWQAWVYDAGNFSTLPLPSQPGFRVDARGISENGRYVTGSYRNAAVGRDVGFVFDRQAGAVVAEINPGGVQTFILATGVNNAGQVVGNYGIPGGRVSFLFDLTSGTRTEFDFPGLTSVSPRGINDNGQIAGWAYPTNATVTSTLSWVGTPQGYQVVSQAVGGFGALGTAINNPGQVVGYYLNASGGVVGNTGGFVTTLAALPTGPGPEPFSHAFDLPVQADVPVFIDPLVAVGYRYRTGSGDPNFKTVSLPLGVGDNSFEIVVGAQRFTVAGHQIFDFTANGFAGGVGEFVVEGIEPEALLDPSGQGQFVTRLTFAGSGRFTGTQTALTMDYTPPIPEPGTWALMALGLAGLLRQCRQRTWSAGRQSQTASRTA